MPARRVIPNVPKVAFYPATNCPEDLPFAACMRSLAEFLGDPRFGCYHSRPEEKSRPVPCANKFFVGLSGIGFAMGWKWELGGFSLLNIDTNPAAHIERCFAALGMGCSILANRDHERGRALVSAAVMSATAEEIERAVRSSVDRGMPCLAFGVFPPLEPLVVAGYDGDGAELIGWSQFQDFPEWKAGTEYEKEGYFRRRDWRQGTACVVIPEKRLVPAPSLESLVFDAVRAGLGLMESRQMPNGFVAGLRGWQALVDALRDPAAFPPGDDALLRERFRAVNGIAGDIAEARCYAADFLGMDGRGMDSLLARARDGAAREAARDRIERATGRFLVIHDLMWRVWEEERGDSTSLGWPVTEHRYLGEPKVRQRIARVCEAARDADAEARDFLAAAVKILEGATSPEPLPDTVVLPRVRYVGFDSSRTGGRSKTTYMAAALESLLGAVGEEYSYPYIMGVSGAAFRLAWNVERWDGGNISTLWMDEDPLEHYRRVIRSTGWNARYLGNRLWKPPVAEADRRNEYLGVDYLGDTIEYSGDEKEFRELVRWGVVARQYPLLCIGTVLPPEAGIICGHDARADAVIGYHHFQVFPENTCSPDVSFDAEGRFVKRNWFRDTLALIGFVHKGPKPPLEKTYREALATALRLARTPRFRRHWSGLAAYEAWARALEGPWPDDVALPLMCHNDAIACIMDGRAAAGEFMRDAAKILPSHAVELERIAGLYGEVTALGRKMIAIQGGFRDDPAPALAVARPEKRRELAAAIRQAAAVGERIASALEPLCPKGT